MTPLGQPQAVTVLRVTARWLAMHSFASGYSRFSPTCPHAIARRQAAPAMRSIASSVGTRLALVSIGSLVAHSFDVGRHAKTTSPSASAYTPRRSIMWPIVTTDPVEAARRSRMASTGEHHVCRAKLALVTVSISLMEARRIALAAQGFGKSSDPIALVAKLGVLQLDSVNVVCRAHYLPLFARAGPYDRAALDEASWGSGRKRKLFEYWGHEASLLPIAMQPLFRWRMERAAKGEGVWGHIARFGSERKKYIDEVLAEVRARGPVRASEIVSHGVRRRGTWWTRSDAKIALEWLFWTGRVSTATRRHFERIYDVTERVLPASVLARATPTIEDAQRSLLEISARALGIATEDDLADYFRLSPREARPRIEELVEAGTIARATVQGWTKPAFVVRGVKAAPVKASALVAPFDPIVWRRPRAERLFDFSYRIEIYTPAPKRKYGYYVLPFLLGDRLVARVDLKADRAKKVLELRAAHAEKHTAREEIAPPLARTLRSFAAWLDLERVSVGKKGDIAGAVRRAMTALE